MKKVEAIVTLSALEKIVDAIGAIGAQGVTVIDLSRLGPVDRVLKVKIEVVVPDGIVPGIVDAVERSTSAGRAEDGGLCVIDVEGAIGIGDGERDRGVG
jgi:nitrogen regulatory protein P-II 1